MDRYFQQDLLGFILCIVAGLITGAFIAGCQKVPSKHESVSNKDIIRTGFEHWAKSEGSFFDLLAEDVTWTIVGNSPVSKTYTSKKMFITEVIDPLNGKLSVKIKPRLLSLTAEGNMVIALWHGKAIANDGQSYENMYSWHLKMKQGKIIEVVAFFDTIEFTGLWNRIDAPVPN